MTVVRTKVKTHTRNGKKVAEHYRYYKKGMRNLLTKSHTPSDAPGYKNRRDMFKQTRKIGGVNGGADY